MQVESGSHTFGGSPIGNGGMARKWTEHGQKSPSPCGGGREGRAADGQGRSSPDPWMGSEALSEPGWGQCGQFYMLTGLVGQRVVIFRFIYPLSRHLSTYNMPTLPGRGQLWTKTMERDSQPAGLVPSLPPFFPLYGSTLPCLDNSLPTLAHSCFPLCRTGFLFFSTCT